MQTSKRIAIFHFAGFCFFVFLLRSKGIAMTQVTNIVLCIGDLMKVYHHLDGVSSMIKDVNGFLWIGTGFGLNRFDGGIFKKYVADQTKKKQNHYR
jgi:ligand-binding sensor domain-containing protein